MVANTSGSADFDGRVLCDLDLNRAGKTYQIAYSNRAVSGKATTAVAAAAVYCGGSQTAAAQIASLPIHLQPWEVQILVPMA